MTQMGPYECRPLRADADEIRLLSLLPATSSYEVTINIEAVPLGETKWPKYEALSYTWGSSEDRVSLRLGGSKKRKP